MLKRTFVNMVLHRILNVMFFLVVVSRCNKVEKVEMVRFKRTFFRMYTITEVTIVQEKWYQPNSLWRSVDSLLLDWEKRFSISGEKSEIRIINERRRQSVPVGTQLSEMIAVGLQYGDSLDGGFDLTILPIKEVWGFDEGASDSMPLPSNAQIDSALAAVSYTRVRLNAAGDSILFSDETSRIDVGGIAKGFVLREVARMFDQRGVADYLIVAGGDVVGKGRRPDGRRWTIGIQHPRDQNGMIGTLTLDSGSVVTSGDYERYRIVDGKRYHHLFDSKTGQSCCANRSVTVWGMNPIVVDLLSTGLFCRPAEDVVAYINKRPGFQCLVVDSTGMIFTSRGWRGKINKRLARR